MVRLEGERKKQTNNSNLFLLKSMLVNSNQAKKQTKNPQVGKQQKLKQWFRVVPPSKQHTARQQGFFPAEH